MFIVGVAIAVLVGPVVVAGSASAQNITFTKTADPTTYTAAGQIIDYTYVLSNSGSFSAFLQTISDDKVASVDCPDNEIPPTGTLTCTGSYSILAGDVTAGSVTNIATATIDTCGDDCFDDFIAQATVTFVAQPSWTLVKSANPTTYSGAGQPIVYGYLLTNTGNVAISSIALTDNPLGPITCPATSLAAGANMTCMKNYATTAADVTAGSVTNVATASGTPTAGTLADATDDAVITLVAPPTGSITIVKNSGSRDETFSFTSTVPGTAIFSLATAGGTASRAFTGLNSATYTFTEVNLPFDWDLATLNCTGDTGGTPTTVDVANRTASVGLDAGEAITCTFANAFQGQQQTVTKRVIDAFLTHRIKRLSEGPDRTRIFRRIPDYLWGGTNGGSAGGASGTGGSPVALVGSSTDTSMQMSVATSLVQLSESYAQARGESQLPMPSVDVWVEMHFSKFVDDAANNSDGHFGVAYVGADYLVTPSVIVGALAQFDWSDEDSSTGSSASGVGVMAGPYVSARLGPNLYFTSRAAWGISENEVDPFGLYTDDFTTDCWLASAELTGNWNFGNWRVTPGATITYVEENQQSYTDSIGVLIPGGSVALGQVTFGPEFAYRILAASGAVFEPHIALTGAWDFESPGAGSVGGFATTGDEIHAKVKAGVLAQTPGGGATFRVVGTYDGIGADGYQSYGGQAWLSIPLR